MTMQQPIELDRTLSRAEHNARMERIRSEPVPRGKDFEARLEKLLQRKLSTLNKMDDGATRDAAERDIDAIKWALNGTRAR